jgi:hypothetical protein
VQRASGDLVRREQDFASTLRKHIAVQRRLAGIWLRFFLFGFTGQSLKRIGAAHQKTAHLWNGAERNTMTGETSANRN